MNGRPRGDEPSHPELPRRPEPPAGASTPDFVARALGAGELPAADPAAFGPDDPGYGPPLPRWHAGEERAGQQPAAELPEARGPFEPLPHPGGSGQELVAYQPVGDEPPGTGEDATTGGGTEALGQIREFYLTAGATGPEDLDKHIELLLERQRQLISDYFKEAGTQENPR